MEPKKSILVVDDDKDILETLTDLLMLKGYEVDTAENAKDAMEKSKTRTFNLALLDIKLPDMEGTELLSKLHQTKPQMMKIMVTGSPTLHNAIASLNLGADAYILKPVSPKELLKVVEEKLAEQSRVCCAYAHSDLNFSKCYCRNFNRGTCQVRIVAFGVHHHRSIADGQSA
jgi:DNA-binding response OmpR family regulator